ncbi:hypothetical protein [Bradyrhizobium sp. dw_78]|uniref:hypothetical protein n=1 Tax=Bradyrhizobium sp. dw_78 TaxID=2719793 RepID=UPI001BD3968F|nr:hypothetical protein [Bradyrhizobium sp. dw_78]
MRCCRRLFAIAILCLAGQAAAEPPQEPDTVAFALMSGKCSTLKIAGSVFACKAVSFYQTELGRANFTIVLDDPADDRHIVTFSGDNGRRQDELYELPIDRMLLKSRERPTADGLPVAAVELSTGKCRQSGSFVTGQISRVSCSATDQNGKTYELEFESDGSPTMMWHVRQSQPTIQ